jgi:hypothetical protein
MTFDAILDRFDGEPGVERGTNWRSDGLRINARSRRAAARCASGCASAQAAETSGWTSPKEALRFVG